MNEIKTMQDMKEKINKDTETLKKLKQLNIPKKILNQKLGKQRGTS
jgi:hypothetical protein